MAAKKKTQKEHKLKSEVKEFRKQFAKKTLDLMTSGFGLVAALAWNEVIKEFIENYVKPIFGEQSERTRSTPSIGGVCFAMKAFA